MYMNEIKLSDLRWCRNCLSMSTRPRIQFDSYGWCNACNWAEKKKTLDWAARQRDLEALLNRHRRNDGRFDCLIPVSGGKDGSYVAYNVKHKYGMHPLAVTVTPALPLPLGEENLRSFVASGYNHISINANSEAMRALNKTGFIEMGFPYYGWLICMQAAVVRTAINYGIGLIFYGEDGEVEYGGTTETGRNPLYRPSYMKKIYLEGGYDRVLERSGLSGDQLYFFQFPTDEECEKADVDIAHWSYFENWDPYRNYLVAKEYCGLKEAEGSNAGTFTNFAQNDQAFYALHTYLMYLKFGFGRANQDACIEVRRGAMDRAQALNLVKLYDGVYPDCFLAQYLDYYRMSKIEFELVLDRWVNKSIFEKVDGRWRPLFKIE